MSTKIITNIQNMPLGADYDATGVLLDTKYLKKTGGTMTGALNFANNTWNVVGDDIQMGDRNVAGTLFLLGKNGQTAIAFQNYGTNTAYYTKLLSSNVTANITLTMPASSGTLALTSQLPTVNNGKLNLQASGTTKVTFTANQSTDSTLNIATGSKNGTISVGGADVSVKGLGSNAYTSTKYIPYSDETNNDVTAIRNLTISGNLVVNGTTTTVNSTSLEVTDALITVAKGNTAALTQFAGIVVPKYDGTNSGALVFDSTGTAYVGDATLTSSGTITAQGDMKPLATRTGTFTNNHIAIWDSSTTSIKDSGKTLSDYLALSGGTMTGGLLVNTTAGSQGNVVASQAITASTANTKITDFLKLYGSFAGTMSALSTDGTSSTSLGWQNVISVRHRNGDPSDGPSYGLYIRSALTSSGSLIWNKQTTTNTWQGERTILDSGNYSSWAAPKDGSSSIVTVGTITTGVWNGTAVPVSNGGTGATSASVARTNLGLGSAATYGATSSVTSGSTSLVTSGAVYTYAAAAGHTHETKIETTTDASSLTLSHGSRYKITAGGTSYVFTMPSDNNSWRAIQANGTQVLGSGTGTGALNIATGSGNGSISVGGTDVAVKGLGTAAYASISFANGVLSITTQ